METITTSCIKLNASATDKTDAIRQAGQLLVGAGFIAPRYINSLLQRETVANTYLGSGVAIPHGMVDDRHLIARTGVAVVQVPAGVEWKDGERAQLIVAIAAQSDEHIALLRRLTRLMQQPAQLEALIRADDPAMIIHALVAPPPATPPIPATGAWQADAQCAWTVDYPNGLHARPATQWVESARRFSCELRVIKGAESANAKALTDLLALGLVCGDTVTLAARGAGAERALAGLRDTVQVLSAGEQADAANARRRALAARQSAPEWTPQDAARSLYGIGASPGLAVGTLVRHAAQHYEVADTVGDVIADGEALEAALQAVRSELEALARSTRERLGASEAAVISAQRELLTDPGLLREALATIMQSHGPAWAWQRALQTRVQKMQSLSDPLLAARALDLRDAGERVLAKLLGVARRTIVLNAPSILVADDLTPSDTLHLDTQWVVGLAIAAGGPTSHTAILARTLGLPALVAAGPALLTAPEGSTAVLDGSAGCLYLEVSTADQARAAALIAAQRATREALREARYAPATTRDGHNVEIAANVADAAQATAALEAGAEGVGLMRTEFLFLGSDTAPDEDAQYAAYRAMVEALGGRPLVIRALDIGGDKHVPYLKQAHEDNPFLGVRGARLLLQRQDLLYTQLRALYRAAQHGPLAIMFPMIAHPWEIEALRTHCERVRQELDAPALKIGIMIEVPAAALMADALAPLVDFFSIGTNDLTQYTLAVDRQHPELAPQADSLHPAVLRLIDTTVRAAHAAGKWVGVCGGLAGDALGARLLTGLGVDELSMSAQDIATVKASLRADAFDALQALAQRALKASSAAEVRAL